MEKKANKFKLTPSGYRAAKLPTRQYRIRAILAQHPEGLTATRLSLATGYPPDELFGQLLKMSMSGHVR